jgi:hypothetical protein
MYNFGSEFGFKAMIVFAVIGIIAAIGGVIYVFIKLFEFFIQSQC